VGIGKSVGIGKRFDCRFFFKYYFLGCNLVRFHTMLLFWNW